MTPALLLAAMMGVGFGPEDTTLTRHFDGCNWTTCDAWNQCTITSRFCAPTAPPISDAPDTIGYWLSRRQDRSRCFDTARTICPPVEVVDTIPVMRKR